MSGDHDVDEIHNHPTVQGLLRWQRRHHYILILLAVTLGLVTGFWIHDYYFVARSVL